MSSSSSPATPAEAVWTWYGVYLACFIGQYCAGTIIDRLKVWDSTVRKMSIKAHDNILEELEHDTKMVDEIAKMEERANKRHLNEMGSHTFKGLPGKDAAISPESDARQNNAAPDDDAETDASKKDSPLRKFVTGDVDDDEWACHKGFKVSLLNKRTYYKLKIEDLQENTIIYRLFSRFKDDKYDKYVDMFYYICNNHTLLSMIAAERIHPFSRNDNRMQFLIRHSLALLFSCIIVNSGLDFGEAFIINSAFCTPMITILNLIFRQLSACPILEMFKCEGHLERLREMLILVGESMGKILALGSVYIFYLAATFSYTTQDFSNLGKYAYQILVTQQATELILISLMFIQRYVVINVFCIPVMAFGGWFASYAQERGIDPTQDMELLRIIPGILSINFSRQISAEYLASRPLVKPWELKNKYSSDEEKGEENNNSNDKSSGSIKNSNMNNNNDKSSSNKSNSY